MLKSAIAFRDPTQVKNLKSIKSKKMLTVNAMLTVSCFPCITNVKNEITDTKIGAHVHNIENMTEFTRAVYKHQTTPDFWTTCVTDL